MSLSILTLTTDGLETLPAQSSPSLAPELQAFEASLLCQHCPCLEGKLLQTLRFRILNNFPVTPSQELLITHPASSDGLCLPALVHTLGRKLRQDRNWFISGSSILCYRVGDSPARQDAWQGSGEFRIGHWSLLPRPKYSPFFISPLFFSSKKGLEGDPSLNSALLIREFWALVHKGVVTQAIPGI